MSAISSVGSSTATQFAEQMQRRQSGLSGGTDFAAQMKSMFESAAKTAGVSDSDLPGLMEKVQKAVDDAKSNGSKDPSAIKTAIDGVLKENGVDVEKFQTAMEAQRPHGGQRPSGPPPASGPRGAHGHHGGHKPEKTESTDSTDSTEQTELEKLIASLKEGAAGESTDSLIAALKEQVTGSGTLLDVAA